MDGFVLINGQTHSVGTVTMDTAYHSDSYTPDGFQFEITDTQGRTVRLDGEPETIIPLDFEYDDEIGRLRRGPTRFTVADAGSTGYSSSLTTAARTT